MEDKINDESKKTSTHTSTTGTWNLVLGLISGGTFVCSKKITGLRSAQGRMQLKHVVRGQEEEARHYSVRLDS